MAPDGKTAPSPESFVAWSRDFLAIVAAPATVHSIGLTRDYIEWRAWRWIRVRRVASGLRRVALGKRRNAAPAGAPPLELEPLLPNRLGHWFAWAVSGWEWTSIGMVAVTIITSIYALSGTMILANEAEFQAQWLKVDAQVEVQEEKLLALNTLPVSFRQNIKDNGLCDTIKPQKPREDQPSNKKLDEPRILLTMTHLERAILGFVGGQAPALPEEKVKVLEAIQSRHLHLCVERTQTLAHLFVSTKHLESWSSVVTQRLGETALELWGFRLGGIPHLAPLFGVSPATINEYATDRNGKLCYLAFPDEFPKPNGFTWPDETPSPEEKTNTTVKKDLINECETFLFHKINLTHVAAQSILASITLYVLPVCYAFLGAMAASFRMIRWKVDASTLTYTDRGRIKQTAILGILFGSVMGLFATYVVKAEGTSNLALSALGLLGGYNVDGVFRFLDEFSGRVFRAAKPAAPSGS